MTIFDPQIGFLWRTPAPPLSRHVDQLWYSATDGGTVGYERVLPTGAVQLVFRLDQDPILRFDEHCQNETRFDHTVVSGASSRPFVKATYQRARVVGVSFRPAGASSFFREPQWELTNLHLPTEALWGGWVRELRNRLLDADSPRTMFDILERALLQRFCDHSARLQIVRRAVDRFVVAPTTARVREVADSTGYAPKQFIRLFEQYVGLTPKVFCRVLRFQSVLIRVTALEGIDWAKVAHDCGYCDQSHLIRDFREFANISPSQYRPAAPGRRNHVAIDRNRATKSARR